GRAGHFPGRIEAESMVLSGYQVQRVTPWETASGGQAVACPPMQVCAATYQYHGVPGSYDIVVQYFDENDGASTFRLLVGGREVTRWTADADFPSKEPNGHTSTRRVARSVPLAPGDEIRIEGTPDGDEGAPVDYIELAPAAATLGSE